MASLFIIGAIFIDGGMEKARAFIYKHLLSHLNKAKILNKNYKGMLIEKCHELSYKQSNFKLIKLHVENRIELQASININNISYVGIGETKQKAEINAAKKAFKKINKLVKKDMLLF